MQAHGGSSPCRQSVQLLGQLLNVPPVVPFKLRYTVADQADQLLQRLRVWLLLSYLRTHGAVTIKLQHMCCSLWQGCRDHAEMVISAGCTECPQYSAGMCHQISVMC